MALLQARGVNLVVLDESTNLEQLEQAPERYAARCCWSPTTGGCSRTSGSTSTGRPTAAV